MPEISINEVKKHKSKKSLWMVIHNDVYDVTKFLEEHPGGEDTLLENAGKDATQAFEDVGHSEDARELLTKFKIGTLPGSEKKQDIPVTCCNKCKPLKGPRPPCPTCQKSRQDLKTNSKPWRTFDGPPNSKGKSAKPLNKTPITPKTVRRVDSVIVPTGSERNISHKLRWALLALAGAIIIGVVLHKTLNK